MWHSLKIMNPVKVTCDMDFKCDKKISLRVLFVQGFAARSAFRNKRFLREALMQGNKAVKAQENIEGAIIERISFLTNANVSYSSIKLCLSAKTKFVCLSTKNTR